MADIQPNRKTSEETAAGALQTTDLVRLVQGTGTDLDPFVSRKSTIGAIVDLLDSSSGIQSIVPGTNVTVDTTDPANPIVSAASETGPDTPPTVPNAMDDEYDNPTFNTSKWSWVQQNTATAVIRSKRLIMTSDLSSGNVPNMIEQPLPASGDCAFVVKASMYIPVGSNYACALHIRDSSNAITGVGIFNGAGPFIIATGTVSTGYTVVPTTLATAMIGTIISVTAYYKVEFIGTTMKFSISHDGVLYGVVYTTSFSTRPGFIGHSVRANNSAGKAVLSVDYFRRIS